MGQQFNADEVFDIAQQIERNGWAFYRRAAEFAANDETRRVLLDLAAMEEDHERIFVAMQAELRDQKPDWLSTFFSVDGETEAALYLQAVADGRVFDLRSAPADALTESTSLEEILRTAIGLEKDTIVFYLGVKQAVPAGLGKEKLEAILFEEMGHVASLSNQLAELKA